MGNVRQWKDANNAFHQTLNYTYDSRHRLTSIKRGMVSKVSYTLNGKNLRVQTSFSDAVKGQNTRLTNKNNCKL